MLRLNDKFSKNFIAIIHLSAIKTLIFGNASKIHLSSQRILKRHHSQIAYRAKSRNQKSRNGLKR